MSEQRHPETQMMGRLATLAAAGAAGLLAVSAVNGGLAARAQTPPDPGARVEPSDDPDAGLEPGAAQTDEDTAPTPGVDVDIFGGGGGTASELLHVPVTKLFPGAVEVNPAVRSPVADDAGAAQRGMDYFNQMNCVGCHAANGAGGMGPALSNSTFIYGSDPENIYLSILQGRPNGMPAWGGMLPDQVIWDIVAYIESISKDGSGSWGKTISADGFTIEQVPAEYITTVDPWAHTTPFSYGQAPFEKPKGAPPLETPGDGEKPK